MQRPLKRQFGLRPLVICNFLTNCRTQESLAIATSLLEENVISAVFPLYMILRFSENFKNLDLSILSQEHIEKLIEILGRGVEDSGWALETLHIICERIPEAKTTITRFAAMKKGVLLTALKYCQGEPGVCTSLSDLLKMEPQELEQEPIGLIHHLELDWEGNEVLFVNLLKLKNIYLATMLCETVGSGGRKEPVLIKLNIESLDWILDWVLEAASLKSRESYFFLDRFSYLLAKTLNREQIELLITEFNDKNSKYRKILHVYLLPIIGGVTLRDLTKESIDYLIENIETDVSKFRGGLLSRIATEKFVEEMLLPAMTVSKGKKKSNLMKLVDRLGKKHGRRYRVK